MLCDINFAILYFDFVCVGFKALS